MLIKIVEGMTLSSHHVNSVKIIRPSGVTLPFIVRDKLKAKQSLNSISNASNNVSIEIKDVIPVTTSTPSNSDGDNNTNSENIDDDTTTPTETEEENKTSKEIGEKIKTISLTIHNIQKSLYHGEESYYDESMQYGNIFKGWEYNTFIDYKLPPASANNILGTKVRVGRVVMPNEERWFSNSCHTSRYKNPILKTQVPKVIPTPIITTPNTPTITNPKITSLPTKEPKNTKGLKMYAIPRKQQPDMKSILQPTATSTPEFNVVTKKKISLDSSGSSKREKKRSKKRKTDS